MLANRLQLGSDYQPAYGATLSNFSVSSSNASPTESNAGVLVGSDGNIYAFTEDGNTFEYQWLTGDGDASDYQAYLSLDSGNMDPLSDSQDTWLGLAPGRTWFSFRTTVGSTVSTYTLKIRDVHTLTEWDSCTVTATCTVT